MKVGERFNPTQNQHTANAAFSAVENRFSAAHGGRDGYIRGDGQNLYVSPKASLASVKAFFGHSDQLNARAAKREAGVTLIKNAIDTQYNSPGLGDAIFARLERQGTDLSKGVKRSDIDTIKADIAAFQNQTPLEKARDMALADKATGIGSTSMKSDEFRSYVSRHFDVCASPEFWSHAKARQNTDVFGAALSLSVLERIHAKGSMDAKDFADLNKALNPYVDPYVSASPTPSPALIGPMVGDTFKELATFVLDRYFTPDSGVSAKKPSDYPLNLDVEPIRVLTDVFADDASNDSDILGALRGGFTSHTKGEGMAAFTLDRLAEPLKAIS